MPDAVIFDMDGLMFDSEPIWTEAWGPTLKLHGIDEVPDGLPNDCRGTVGTYEAKIVERYFPGVDGLAVANDLQRVGSKYMMEHGVPKKPGLDDLLEYLDAQKIPCAVASSSVMELIESDLEKGGVRKYFKKLVSGSKLAHPKPAPDVFLKAADELGVEPARTVVLEDSINGIKAAHAGGFIPVMVPDIVQPTPEIRSMAKAVCKDLSEVRGLLERGDLD